MEIIKVMPRGFCRGVVEAIQIAKNTRKQYPDQDIYIVGMLVHNTYVMKALETYGIQTIHDTNKSRSELLATIDHGVVIFTAHGVHHSLKEQATRQGLICIDASCVDVLSTQSLVDTYIKEGYHVLYVGKKGHPEAEAVCFNNPDVTLIEAIQDVETLPYYDHLFVTNQTTMSIYDTKAIFETIKQKFPHAIIADEICNATRTRQEAIANLKNVDMLIIVGDAASNNSNRLAQIGRENGITRVYQIDTVNDLLDITLDVESVAVSAGASTPTYLTNQVIAYLQNPDGEAKVIEIDKIL